MLLGVVVIAITISFLGLMLCFLPGIYFANTFSVAAIAVVVEKKGIGQALSRSWKLVNFQWLNTFVVKPRRVTIYTGNRVCTFNSRYGFRDFLHHWQAHYKGKLLNIRIGIGLCLELRQLYHHSYILYLIFLSLSNTSTWLNGAKKRVYFLKNRE